MLHVLDLVLFIVYIRATYRTTAVPLVDLDQRSSTRGLRYYTRAGARAGARAVFSWRGAIRNICNLHRD